MPEIADRFLNGRIVCIVDLKKSGPVLLEPYSLEQKLVVLAAFHRIFELESNRDVLVIDRGLDGFAMFED